MMSPELSVAQELNKRNKAAGLKSSAAWSGEKGLRFLAERMFRAEHVKMAVTG